MNESTLGMRDAVEWLEKRKPNDDTQLNIQIQHSKQFKLPSHCEAQCSSTHLAIGAGGEQLTLVGVIQRHAELRRSEEAVVARQPSQVPGDARTVGRRAHTPDQT